MWKEATIQAEVMRLRATPTYQCRVLLRDSIQDQAKSFSPQAAMQPAGDPCMGLGTGKVDPSGPQALQTHSRSLLCSEAWPSFAPEFSEVSRE